jgi:hypothetical protein
MFGINGNGPYVALMYLNRESVTVLILALLSSTLMFQKGTEMVHKWEGRTGAAGKWTLEIVRIALVIAVVFYCAIQLNAGSYNPFIYFKF